MSNEDFYTSTPREFFNRLNGFNEIRKQDNDWKEFQVKESWKQMQYLSWVIECNNPYIKENDKSKTFDDYINGKKSKKQAKDVFEITSEEQFKKWFNIQ